MDPQKSTQPFKHNNEQLRNIASIRPFKNDPTTLQIIDVLTKLKRIQDAITKLREYIDNIPDETNCRQCCDYEGMLSIPSEAILTDLYEQTYGIKEMLDELHPGHNSEELLAVEHLEKKIQKRYPDFRPTIEVTRKTEYSNLPQTDRDQSGHNQTFSLDLQMGLNNQESKPTQKNLKVNKPADQNILNKGQQNKLNELDLTTGNIVKTDRTITKIQDSIFEEDLKVPERRSVSTSRTLTNNKDIHGTDPSVEILYPKRIAKNIENGTKQFLEDISDLEALPEHATRSVAYSINPPSTVMQSCSNMNASHPQEHNSEVLIPEQTYSEHPKPSLLHRFAAGSSSKKMISVRSTIKDNQLPQKNVAHYQMLKKSYHPLSAIDEDTSVESQKHVSQICSEQQLVSNQPPPSKISTDNNRKNSSNDQSTLLDDVPFATKNSLHPYSHTSQRQESNSEHPMSSRLTLKKNTEYYSKRKCHCLEGFMDEKLDYQLAQKSLLSSGHSNDSYLFDASSNLINVSNLYVPSATDSIDAPLLRHLSKSNMLHQRSKAGSNNFKDQNCGVDSNFYLGSSREIFQEKSRKICAINETKIENNVTINASQISPHDSPDSSTRDVDNVTYNHKVLSHQQSKEYSPNHMLTEKGVDDTLGSSVIEFGEQFPIQAISFVSPGRLESHRSINSKVLPPKTRSTMDNLRYRSGATTKTTRDEFSQRSSKSVPFPDKHLCISRKITPYFEILLDYTDEKLIESEKLCLENLQQQRPNKQTSQFSGENQSAISKKNSRMVVLTSSHSSEELFLDDRIDDGYKVKQASETKPGPSEEKSFMSIPIQSSRLIEDIFRENEVSEAQSIETKTTTKSSPQRQSSETKSGLLERTSVATRIQKTIDNAIVDSHGKGTNVQNQSVDHVEEPQLDKLNPTFNKENILKQHTKFTENTIPSIHSSPSSSIDMKDMFKHHSEESATIEDLNKKHKLTQNNINVHGFPTDISLAEEAEEGENVRATAGESNTQKDFTTVTSKLESDQHTAQKSFRVDNAIQRPSATSKQLPKLKSKKDISAPDFFVTDAPDEMEDSRCRIEKLRCYHIESKVFHLTDSEIDTLRVKKDKRGKNMTPFEVKLI